MLAVEPVFHITEAQVAQAERVGAVIQLSLARQTLAAVVVAELTLDLTTARVDLAL